MNRARNPHERDALRARRRARAVCRQSQSTHTVTHGEAITSAQWAAKYFNAAHVVYRFPAWPIGLYAVIAEARGLPPQAQTFECITPDDVAPKPEGQGSLF